MTSISRRLLGDDMAQLLPPHNKQSRHTGDPSPPQGSPPQNPPGGYICMYVSVLNTHAPQPLLPHSVLSLSLSLSPSQCHNPRPQHQQQLVRTATRNKRKHTRYTLIHEKLIKTKDTHKKMRSCGRGAKRPRKGHRKKALLVK
jgi:hypothetical protein